MKTQTSFKNFSNQSVDERKRMENVPLRITTKARGAAKLTLAILVALLVLLSPLLLQAQTTESFTFTTNRLVPQGNFSGMSDTRTINSAVGRISSLQVRLKITGEFNGDLYAYVRNSSGFTVLLNRVGVTSTNLYGYGDSGFNVVFQANATNGDIHLYQNITTPASGSPLTGAWQPDGRSVDCGSADLSTSYY